MPVPSSLPFPCVLQTATPTRRAWEAAKAYMSGGCSGVTSAAETDFAALVNVIDFCVGLYDAASDTLGEWQPVAGNAADFVATILQPARTARNLFAHNSGLAFDSEAAVVQHINALLALLALLPVPTSDAGGTKRSEAVAKLTEMRELAPSDGDKHDDLRDDLVSLEGSELEGWMASVMRFMVAEGSQEAEGLSGLLPADVVGQIMAEVSRTVAGRGAGGGAGAGAEDESQVRDKLRSVKRTMDRVRRWLEVLEGR